MTDKKSVHQGNFDAPEHLLAALFAANDEETHAHHRHRRALPPGTTVHEELI